MTTRTSLPSTLMRSAVHTMCGTLRSLTVSVCPLTQDVEDGSENAEEPEIGRAVASMAVRAPKSRALTGAVAKSIAITVSEATVLQLK
ncbi:MAG: hypothetical protein WBV85_08510 [Solirubrobacteraceae bacterium]